MTSPQIHAAIRIGIPIRIIDNSPPITARINCQIPAFVFPPIRLPSPGITSTFNNRAIMAIVLSGPFLFEPLVFLRDLLEILLLLDFDFLATSFFTAGFLVADFLAIFFTFFLAFLLAML